MLPLRVTVILIAKVSIFIANMLFGQLPWEYCPLSAEDSLPFAHCLVVCCRQTIVCSHQTIVCSGHTIVWWEQTKCAAAFSLYHLA